MVMVMKKIITDEYKNLATQCAKKASSQAQAARSLQSNFELKYSDDLKMNVVTDFANRTDLKANK